MDLLKRQFGILSYKPTRELLIFGGRNRDFYLGKFNASPNDSDSIWNQHGEFGSKYKSNSIWNSAGSYGSSYSSFSPFCSYASDPPELRDREGNSYGLLTIKETQERASYEVLDLLFKFQDKIRDNPSMWYDLLLH